jgi:hypothetical protein
LLTPEGSWSSSAIQRHTLLPLDDGLYGLQPTIPHLIRSSQHHCLNGLPKMDGDKPDKKPFTEYATSHMRVDIAEVTTEGGKLYLFVAID